ncbi:MAG: DUF1214 domain-containing protein [Xanthobacteraceae bacterium]|nr:DUF1214 domain-containing protein [Xanthobacteraceae bacterium]
MRVLFFILALLIGSASGLGLTWLMSSRESGFGAVQIGAWRAWPRSGTLDADPYARAIFARSGELPIGLSEGVAFIATTDDQGRAIDGHCVTRIAGRLLPARFWTLTIYDGRGRLIENPSARYAFTSAEVVYESGGEVKIWLAPRAHTGNWLPTGESERIVAIFRLYDTPAGVARSEAAEMPRITRENCP